MSSEAWVPTRIGEVATQFVDRFDVQLGDSYSNLGVKWYAEGVFTREPKLGSEIKGKNLYRVRPGQFIYNRMFATEGSFAVVADEHADGVVSNEFPVFDLDRTKLLPEFLALNFQQPTVWKRVALECVGTTKSRSRWKEERFLAYQLPLPSIAEQRRIVDLFVSLDEVIEAVEATQLERLNLRDAIADAAFAKARDGRGVMSTLADVVGAGGVIQTGPFGSQLHNHDYVEVGTPVVMPANIRNGRVKTEGIARISPHDVQRLAKHKLQPGDIVWSRRGDVTRFARITEDDEPMICGTGCLLIRPEKPDTTAWLSVWLSSRSMQNLIMDRAVGATMLNLNTSILSGLPVAIPDEKSASTGEVLEATGIADLTGVRHLESLRALRIEFLSSLLSGAHRIPETYDELMGA